MDVFPQAYPLWLAEFRDGEVHAGRVVGWQVATPVPGFTGNPVATPIAAFTTPDGLLLETCAPHSPVVFLADTREEAVAAARRVGGSPAPFPPLAGEEDDDEPRPPDARTRTHSLRRLTIADLTDPAGPDADASVRRTLRNER